MKALDLRNPLVALAKEQKPHLNDDQARIVAMEIRDQHAQCIGELAEFAESALSILGDGTDPNLVRNALSGFIGGLAAGGVSSRANAFIAALPSLHGRIVLVIDNREGDAARKLFFDCMAMKTGGPAAE